ncbi:MAG TPA: RNA polymerase sigma factor [Longimicrobiales bacterium]
MSKDSSGFGAQAEETDGEVVARVRAGDREAYRILVRRYQDMLYRYALRMTGSRDTAADLVQAAFVKAYAGIRHCREPDRFGAWVFRILANACKDHLRSRQNREVALEDSVPSSLRAPSDPLLDLERSELRGLLADALRRLSDQQREAFILKHVEGRPYEEIAKLLNVSVSALKMRVHRARELLKAVLEEVL